MLLGVLAFGSLFAWAQMARGAHYPSHSLWSAWLCWVAVMASDYLLNRRRRAARQPSHSDAGAP
jgi:membrane-associated PAP2 superfamily phosphatase